MVALTTFITTTGTSTWTCPNDWNNSGTVEIIGCGGNGSARISASVGGVGGGGGGYAYSSQQIMSLVPGTAYTVFVAAGGGAASSWFSASGSLAAGAGGNATTSTAGAAGATGSGTWVNNNAAGGHGFKPTSGATGGGGGGAGSFDGAGTAATTTAGGATDAGNTAGPAAGNNGTTCPFYDSTHGPGTGAGGSTSGSGKTGGSYGGGGSGASDSASGNVGGTGGQGLIVIVYEPSSNTGGSSVPRNPHRHRHPSQWLPKVVPDEEMEIDWANPITRGLIGCWVPAQGSIQTIRNMVGIGGDLTATGTVKFSVSPVGVGATSTTDGANGWKCTSPPAAFTNLTTAASLYWYGIPIGTTDDGTIPPPLIGVTNNSTAAYPWYSYALTLTSFNTINLYADTHPVATNTFNIGATNAVTLNVPMTIVGRINNPTDAALYYSGQGIVASDGASKQNITYGSGPQIWMGADFSNSFSSKATTFAACIWNRPLFEDEAALLDREPFCFLRPVAKRVFKGPVSTGTNANVTGVNGTGAVGTLVASVQTGALTGVNGTGAAGSVTASVKTGSLTGVNGTGAAGAVIPSVAASISGVNGTGAAGNVTTFSGTSASISGVSGTGAAGTFTSDIFPGPGSVIGTGIAAGLGPQDANSLVGVNGTGAAGALTDKDQPGALTGVNGTGAVGAVIPSVAVTIAGVNGTGVAGSLTTFSGSSGTITGCNGTGAAGTFGVEIDVNTGGITGVFGTGAVGILTASGPAPPPAAPIAVGGAGDDERDAEERRQKWLEWSRNRKQRKPEPVAKPGKRPLEVKPAAPIPVPLPTDLIGGLLQRNLESQRAQMIGQTMQDVSWIAADELARMRAQEDDDEEAISLLLDAF